MSRNIRIAGFVLATGVGVAYIAPKFFNPASTPAVRSIEERYSSAGATPSGERATSTKMGDTENTSQPAESKNQQRLREQKEDLLGSNTQMPKGDNMVFGRASDKDRPKS